jgi:hypothetical protein
MCVFVQVCYSGLYFGLFGIFSSLSIIFLVLGHQMMDEVQKYTTFNGHTWHVIVNKSNNVCDFPLGHKQLEHWQHYFLFF